MAFNPAQKRDEQGQWTSDTLVYHGTDAHFTEFDETKAGKRDGGHLGRGIYFSTDANVGKTNLHQMQALLVVKNPLRVSLPNFKTDKRDVVRKALSLGADATPEQVTARLKKQGHDAVVLDYSPAGYPHQEVMVPHGSQAIYLRHTHSMGK